MTHWNTAAVKALLADSRWTMTSGPPGGDYDTEIIQLVANDRQDDESFLQVSGFTPGVDMRDPRDAQLQLVEVTDGRDSRGGLNTADEATCLMYGDVVGRLRAFGFSVVTQMRDCY